LRKAEPLSAIRRIRLGDSTRYLLNLPTQIDGLEIDFHATQFTRLSHLFTASGWATRHLLMKRRKPIMAEVDNSDSSDSKDSTHRT
jgi:hypothetical protein